MKNDIIYYSVGALLYCPANKKTIADSVIHENLELNILWLYALKIRSMTTM